MLLAPAFAALVVAISSTADVSPTLVDHVIDETNAIWKPAGITLAWQRTGAPASLEVVIGRQRGTAKGRNTPLGWIEFDDGRPRPRVYLSYGNAVLLFEAASGVVGVASRMPVLERETYLGRALGRALAHEIGHYLLEARTHTQSGVMKANFTAAELFLPDTRHFTISRTQEALALARVEQVPLVASATSGSSSPTSRQPASKRQGAARWSGPTPY